jgi:hypothetical protein
MDVIFSEETLFIDLSEQEVFSLIDGHLGGDRKNPFGIGGKINIHPSSDDFISGVRHDHTLEVSGDNDIDVYIDETRLKDVRLAGLHFPKDAVIGVAGDEHLEYFKSLLPENGIIIRFAGSLGIINLCNYYVEK